MNHSLMAAGGLETIVDAPVGIVLVWKATALLLAAWTVHLALARCNPRWRVLLWRATAAGLVALPVIGWLPPALQIRLEPPPTRVTAAPPLAPAVPSPSDSAAKSSDRTLSQPSHTPEGHPVPLHSGGLSDPETRLLNEPLPRPALSGAPHGAAQMDRRAGLRSPSHWRGIVVAIWMAGMGILVLRWMIGHFRLQQIVGRAEHLPRRIRNEFLEVARGVGCRNEVNVRQSVFVQSPLLCGLRRPVLLLPARMCEGSYRDDLPAIFAHELAHVRFRDPFWNAGLHAIFIALWFHPLAWRLRWAHLAACELVCDAVSAHFLGNVAGYCRTLARVAVESAALLPAAGIAMARTSAIGRRLNVLKRQVFHSPLRWRSALAFGLAVLLGVGALGGLQLTWAISPPVQTVASAGQPDAKAAQTPAANQEQPSAEAASKTAVLNVRVVDESGKPLAGTILKAAYLGHKAEYTTDTDGRAKVAVPAPNGKFFSLIAYPEGYPPVRKWWRNEAGKDLIPAEFTFAYEEGRTIGATVRDEQGKPVQEAKVHLSISSVKYDQVGMCLALWDQVLVTDTEGRWHLDHVPQFDDLSVGLEHPDYISDPGPTGIPDAEQRKIEDRTAVMVMKRGISVSGMVTDPEGKPVADAKVIVGEWYSPTRISATTDQQGRYRFASLAPGAADLTVIRPGLAPALRNISVQTPMEPVDFQLEEGHTLRVRVVGKDGKPISGVFVTPDTWRGKRVLSDIGARGRTDAEGRWTWTWAPKDAVETDFGLTGRVNYMSIDHLPLTPQADEHVVTLYPALAITGQVIDAETKQPIPTFRVVRGYMSTGSVEQIMWDRIEPREGADGRYELMITRPSRTHLVRIEANGYQPAVSREFKNDEGRVTCDFALNKGQNLEVRIQLPDGKPAGGADVRLCPYEPGKVIRMGLFVKNGRFPYRDPSTPSLKTGPDGRLPLGVQDRPFLLVVLHEQGLAQISSEDLADRPTISLEAWARLEGVLRHGTKPAPEAKVDVYPVQPLDPQWSFLNFQEQTETDAQGKFVFARLKPGKWCVREIRAEPGGAAEPARHQQTLELAAGQTRSVVLGGVGRPIVGRIQWPGGGPPDADLSRIVADVSPKMPDHPSPPKAIQDRGPDAVRVWHKQWMESDEGKAWQSKVRNSGSRQSASVSREGTFRIEEGTPGDFELGVYVVLNDDTMPWERPESLRYSCAFSIPEIPGGVSDEPLDLGILALVEKSPKELPSGPAQPPAPQPPGTESVGSLRDHFELLRYVIATYRENKAKILTWQGRSAIETRSRFGHEKHETGEDYTANVQFAFDRAKKSVLWNTTLEKWARVEQGQQTPQPVPQASNGMQTPEALYRTGWAGSPVLPEKRPWTLMIFPPKDTTNGRIQPQLYDFNPLFFLDTLRGDVARDLSAYLSAVDHPGLSRVKVIRRADDLTIDMSLDKVVQRYTVSLSQGCNPIHFETIEPEGTWEYRWTWEIRDGIWLPKTWSETVRQKDGRDQERKVTFVENRVNQPLEPNAFALSRLGLEPGDNVDDRRTGQKYQFQGD